MICCSTTASILTRRMLETTRYVSRTTIIKILLDGGHEHDQQGNDQCINSDGFSEHDCKNHVGLDRWCGFWVTTDRFQGSAGENTDADARSDSSDTDGECGCELNWDDKNPP